MKSQGFGEASTASPSEVIRLRFQKQLRRESNLASPFLPFLPFRMSRDDYISTQTERWELSGNFLLTGSK